MMTITWVINDMIKIATVIKRLDGDSQTLMSMESPGSGSVSRQGTSCSILLSKTNKHFIICFRIEKPTVMLAGKKLAGWRNKKLGGEIDNKKGFSRIIGILRNRREGDDDDWIGIDSKRGFN